VSRDTASAYLRFVPHAIHGAQEREDEREAGGESTEGRPISYSPTLLQRLSDINVRPCDVFIAVKKAPRLALDGVARFVRVH
jgi:hypothetical protein